jgi:hypothetical protein
VKECPEGTCKTCKGIGDKLLNSKAFGQNLHLGIQSVQCLTSNLRKLILLSPPALPA